MKHWSTIPLSDAYWFQEGPGVRKWQFRNSGIKLLNVANITKEGVLDLSKTDRCLSEDEVAEKYTHFLVDDGDLVVASSGISFDEDGLLRTRGAFVGAKDLPLCLNTSTIRFKSKPGTSSLALLRYWLDSPEFRQQITRLVTGSAQQNFGPSHLKATKISLPPFGEQERLVKLLDEVNELRKMRAEADQRIDALLSAMFHELFGDPMTNQFAFPVQELGSLCKIVGGGTPSKKQSAYWIGEIPWVSPKDMSADEVHDSEDHISKKALTESATNLIPAGSILVVTRSGILKHTLPIAINSVPVTINQDIKAFIPLADSDPIFIAAQLRVLAPTVLKAVRVGATVQNIETAALKRLRVLNPPLQLQKQFAARVAEVRALEADQTTSRHHLDDLYQSVLHRAFRGEL